MGLVAHYLSHRNKQRRIEGDAGQISIRTYRGNRILKDESFQRKDVTDIRAFVSGSSGSQPLKRVELIVGERSIKLADWMNGEEADALVESVRVSLGR